MTVLRPGEHPDELISASLTGDLSATEQDALTSHLAGCARCRDTLAAFGEERRLISGMRHVPPPRDLGARVRAGIEGGRSGALPWWQRLPLIVPATGALAVAAALLAVVVLTNARPPEVAQQTPIPSAQPSAVASSTARPSASVAPSQEPLPTATVNPQAWIGPGELGHFAMTQEEREPARLSFVKEQTGERVVAEPPPGSAPLVAAISPNGEWVAYITGLNSAGFNQVWALHLTDGETVRLGCSSANPFTDRLIWSWDSSFLAYTLTAIDPGVTLECGGGPVGTLGTTDVWTFQPESGEALPLTTSGDAFAADSAGADPQGGTLLIVSHAAAEPWSEYVRLPEPLDPEAANQRLDGVFMPLLSPRDVGQAVWWTGEMQQSEDGRWVFVRAGMPHLGPLAGESPDGAPLFEDLSTTNGDGFETGNLAWGADGDLIAFWGGLWTGVEQGEGYPDSLGVYAGRMTDGPLTRASQLSLNIDPEVHGQVVSVVFRPDGVSAIVAFTRKLAGDLSPLTSDVVLARIGGGPPSEVPGVSEAPWDGPFVYGPEPKVGPGAGPDDS